MVDHLVTFDSMPEGVRVPTGTLLSEVARMAGIDIMQPCGGQGRCGRCVVKIESGTARRRSTMRLSAEDVEMGYALACQTVVEADVRVVVPAQEKIERRLTTDRTAAEISIPSGYDYRISNTVQRFQLTLSSPSMDDQTDDWSRLNIALRQKAGLTSVQASLQILRRIGAVLRDGNWLVTALVDVQELEGENLKGD